MEVPQFRPHAPVALPDDTDSVVLLAAWWRAAGGPMARLASPRGIHRGRLRIAVPDARWKREIGKHIEEILSRLRRTQGLEELEGVDLVVEHRSGHAAEGGVAPYEPPPEEASREAPSISSIEIAPLSWRLNAAVARILTRREGRHGS